MKAQHELEEKVGLCFLQRNNTTEANCKSYIDSLSRAWDSSDVVSAPECANGADIQLSDKAMELFPYQIEAKNQNRMKEIYKVFRQAVSHGNATPIAIIKRDDEEALLIMKPDVFYKLVANQKKENKWKTIK